MLVDFHSLFERYSGDVHRFALYLSGDASLAEEITQETFVRAWIMPGEISGGTVKAYLLHRNWREQSVLDALTAGATTIRRIVPEVYRGLAPQLIPAATLSVQAHVEYLIEKGLVASDLPLTPDRDLSPL